ncbi:MAG: class I tRNA ligase family protein, partial [Patescibacteria group bacterium]
SATARERIIADLKKRKVATEQTGYKLRDWLISRQRYWGTPIPVIHCKKCGPQPVPGEDLPVELPNVEDYLPTGDGRSPLAKVESFVQTPCPKCGDAAERETDTMDTFADSNWYFLRYPSPDKKDGPFDPAALKAWMPVDVYVGGAEHAVLHLLYARFWTKALADRGHLAFREPFLSLRNQGMILADDGRKMSKSLGNVINPDEVVEGLGADTLRIFEMFIGPFDQSADWSTQGIEGSYRFLKRVWTFGQRLAEANSGHTHGSDKVSAAERDWKRVASQATKRVTESIEGFRFNTAISALMEALNGFQSLADDAGGVPATARPYFERYLVLLTPFAPHIAEELWRELGHEDSIFTQDWPTIDRAALKQETAAIVVQVNGKVRTTVTLPTEGLTEAAAVQAAQENEIVQKHLGDAKPKQVIYVPGKLLNFVV